MATQSSQAVTKDMTVADIIAKYPFAADIMQSYGLSCFGCAVNTLESVEMGAKGHGIPEERMEEMVEEMNSVISSGKTPVREEKPIQPLAVTPKAAQKMKDILTQQKKEGWGIRIVVSAGGCAGYMYGMDFAQKGEENDQVIHANGVPVFIEANSTKLLSGVVIDFVETLQESGFKFENPNAKATCGCGQSFH